MAMNYNISQFIMFGSLRIKVTKPRRNQKGLKEYYSGEAAFCKSGSLID